MDIKIEQNIIDYINQNRSKYELPTPRVGEVWEIERIVKYPTACNGEPVIEMKRKTAWMRIPASLVFSEEYIKCLL
jgi:hypothetical protein